MGPWQGGPGPWALAPPKRRPGPPAAGRTLRNRRGTGTSKARRRPVPSASSRGTAIVRPAAGGRGTGAFSGPAVALPRARARPQTSRLSRHFITSSAGQ